MRGVNRPHVSARPTNTMSGQVRFSSSRTGGDVVLRLHGREGIEDTLVLSAHQQTSFALIELQDRLDGGEPHA